MRADSHLLSSKWDMAPRTTDQAFYTFACRVGLREGNRGFCREPLVAALDGGPQQSDGEAVGDSDGVRGGDRILAHDAGGEE